MKCPYCGAADSKVTDSRPTDDGNSIRRRRECVSCLKRFTTYERIEVEHIYVIKKDGRRQPFDREKIRAGLLKACEKRPIALSQVDTLIADVERELQNGTEQEVTTTHIGELIIRRLKEMDEVAYVRFASVYRQFKDINTFMQELSKLLEDK